MTSTEVLYHFSCKHCKGWWSIAMEKFVPMDREWSCPWCGERELYNEREFPVCREVPPENNY